MNYTQILYRYLLRNSPLAVIALFLLVFGGIALQLLEPNILGRFVTSAQAGAKIESLLGIGLAFCVVAFGKQIIGILTAYLAGNVGWNATNALRNDLLMHMLSLDLEFFKDKTQGELLERVEGDVNILNNFFSRFALELLGNVLLLVGILTALTVTNWQLGAVMAAFTAFAVFALLRIRVFASRIWLALRDIAGRFYGFVGEVLVAREDIRSNGATSFAFTRFWSLVREWWPMERLSMLANAMTFSTPILVFAVGDALAFVLIFRLIQNHELTLGTAYSVFFYIVLLSRPIAAIRGQLQQLQRADAGIHRVRTLLGTQPRIVDGTIRHLPSNSLSVEFADINFAYEQESVLSNVTFELPAGRVLGVLGRTGSGKSTLARLLVRFLEPNSGVICIAGVPLYEMEISALREKIGMVTQDVQLFSASVRDNLTFFNSEVSDDRLWAALTELGLDGWVRLLPDGLDGLIDPSALSAGEAQLLALTRLFLQNPSFIILDEASSRLDRATEARLERALDSLLVGRTVVIIAHRLRSIARADDILILDAGRVVEWGTRLNLAANQNSRFANLVRVGIEEINT
jgi:ATP-binding cassette, subfamily B, bacterial